MELTVLVIENDLETAEFVSKLLRLEGYNVRVELTGRSGLGIIDWLKPDLILCDICLPEIDGYGVLHILNKDPMTARIPFIFLAGAITVDDFRKGMNLGADDYICKPLDCVNLLSAIEARLKKYELIRNNFDGSQHRFLDRYDQEMRPKELSDLFEGGLRRHFSKKEYLFTVGDPQHFLYFIKDGEVKVSNLHESGKEMIYRIVGNQQLVGYESLSIGTVHTEDAVALAATEVSLVKKEDFFQLLYGNRVIAKWLINSLSIDLIHVEKRLINLAYQSVREKVAAALVQVYEHQRLVLKESLLVSLSRKHLAAMVGIALESLNRTILDFKKEGVLEITPKGVQILELSELERIIRQHSQFSEPIMF